MSPLPHLAATIRDLTEYIESLDPAIFGVPRVQDPTLSRLTEGHHNVNFLLALSGTRRRFVVRFCPGDPHDGWRPSTCACGS